MVQWYRGGERREAALIDCSKDINIIYYTVQYVVFIQGILNFSLLVLETSHVWQ